MIKRCCIDMKRLLLPMLAVLLALPCMGQANRFYMEDFEIDVDSIKTLPLLMTNEDEARGFQLTMTLPDGLELISCVTTDYSRQYQMGVSCNVKSNGSYLVLAYPPGRICYPADTAREVLLFTYRATSDFKGGDILISGCKGSTIDNKTFSIQGDTVAVTVPASSLIGIPVDQQSQDDRYFNLMGNPIASPEDVSVAIQVTTHPDGRVDRRKVAVMP